MHILIGIKTDRTTVELIHTVKAQRKLALESHADVRERLPDALLDEFQTSADSADIEGGISKFVEWIKSGKLEVRAYPSERVHAKALHHDVPRGRPRQGARRHRVEQFH